jgi:hypothetical protein
VSRPRSALTGALLVGVLAAASITLGQQAARSVSSDVVASGAGSMASARGARRLLRNGKDYLSYGQYERALQFFAEAEARQTELTATERLELQQSIDKARRGLHETADAAQPSYAKSGPRPRPGAIAAAPAASERPEPNPDAVQLTGATVAEPAQAARPSAASAKTPRPVATDLDPWGMPVVAAPAPSGASPAQTPGSGAAPVFGAASAPTTPNPITVASLEDLHPKSPAATPTPASNPQPSTDPQPSSADPAPIFGAGALVDQPPGPSRSAPQGPAPPSAAPPTTGESAFTPPPLPIEPTPPADSLEPPPAAEPTAPAPLAPLSSAAAPSEARPSSTPAAPAVEPGAPASPGEDGSQTPDARRQTPKSDDEGQATEEPSGVSRGLDPATLPPLPEEPAPPASSSEPAAQPVPVPVPDATAPNPPANDTSSLGTPHSAFDTELGTRHSALGTDLPPLPPDANDLTTGAPALATPDTTAAPSTGAAAPVPAPESVPAPVASPAPAPAAAFSMPPLPPGPPSSPRIRPAPAQDFGALPPLPGERSRRGAAARPAFTSVEEVPFPGSFRSSLTPEQLREVEQIARLQDEAAGQPRTPPPFLNPGATTAESEPPMTRLELPRAPSPSEARPLRSIPVPEDFVPLGPRRWEPLRKYWAAAATCHTPLYFQDAVLERYGYSVEQHFGPLGRFMTYPIDDPKQSKLRNQIAQPWFSAGLFAAQIVLLPVNMVLDPPWEPEYDLGYWRPGDRVPTDIYYLPLHGVGPPLRGSRY